MCIRDSVMVARGESSAHDLSSRGYTPSLAERMQDVQQAPRSRQANPIGSWELGHPGERRHYTDHEGRARGLTGDWRVPPPDRQMIRDKAGSFDAGYKMGWTGSMGDSFAVGLVNHDAVISTSAMFSTKKTSMPTLHAAKPSYEGARQLVWEYEQSLRDEILTPRHVPKPLSAASLTPAQVKAQNLATRHQELVHSRDRAASHLDERHIAANGRLLSHPQIKQMHTPRSQDTGAPPEDLAARNRTSTAQDNTKQVDARSWQPRSLHLGRTHRPSDTTLRSFYGHNMEVLSVAVYKDFLFTASKDRFMRMFDLVTAECLHVFKGHTDWVMDVAVCPKEKKLLPATHANRSIVLLSASADGTARTLR
eukprot:TRINITY_DN8360_c0_g1_i4.p1 TRINITY_DN8360_c0_g1~~TRINITY_DN8360_c0_g1_i4.p1  ORF type:complete len:365 (-),score=81.20 TRINITY_DN8360_c0_g1_i4:136-1230(-)